MVIDGIWYVVCRSVDVSQELVDEVFLTALQSFELHHSGISLALLLSLVLF